MVLEITRGAKLIITLGGSFELLWCSSVTMSKHAVLLLALASAANAVALGDVKHVIMVMFENRSFNHVSVHRRRKPP